MKVNRDFEINGAKFHLNDGKGIFCKSKYILMHVRIQKQKSGSKVRSR